MSNHSAKHYLETYEGRLRMIEAGVTHPSAAVVEAMRKLVNGLAALDPTEPIRLENSKDRWQFKVAATGALVGEFESSDDEADPGSN